MGETMGEVATVRERMIDAGEILLAQRGYGITLLEVMHMAGTPRGSIYYHFPNGKEELAVEVARKVGDDLVQVVARIGRKKDDPVAFLQGLVDHHTKRMVAADFGEGCPVLAITVSVDIDSPELDEAVALTFERWTEAVTLQLRAKGVAATLSADVASTIVSAIEGAMVVCRATRSAGPLKRLRAVVPSLVGPTSRRRSPSRPEGS
jgi:TetR/AcrR family transcriptional regulator, lmrAB and yxaGH operons repressor